MSKKRPTGQKKVAPGSWGALAARVESGDPAAEFEALSIAAGFLGRPEPPEGFTLSLGNSPDDHPGPDYVRFVRAVEHCVGALVKAELDRLEQILGKRRSSLVVARNASREQAAAKAAAIRKRFEAAGLSAEVIRKKLLREAREQKEDPDSVPSIRTIQRALSGKSKNRVKH